MTEAKPVLPIPETWVPDKDWTEEQWYTLLIDLLTRGMVTWKDVTSLILGELNPPQVGTQVASNKDVQAFYGKGKTWQAVKEWLYHQSGRCANCGTRIGLQADHIVPKERSGSEDLANRQLLCRRCNVVKRPSHKKGGLTFLPAEQALMWLLFVYKPETYEEFKQLCRKYGLTMADIRFQEAWAMAEWLKREGQYN